MPTATLDSVKKIATLDSQNMLGSIESLALQCQQAWEDVQQISVPKAYRSVERMVLAGMGGSALGGDVVEYAFSRQLTVPFAVSRQYQLPNYVNRKTLCVISSYSGTTEETLAAVRDARRRKAKIIIICAGGTLARYAKKYRLPAYVFDPRFNPSNQPRMALGYSLIGIVGLLQQAGLLQITNRDFNAAIKYLVAQHKQLGVRNPRSKNPAKQAATLAHTRIPILIAADHLSGNAHIAANQINENGKNFAAYFLISELNHHLMEGLSFPQTNPRQLAFIFLNSRRYYQRNRTRVTITQRVAKKKKIPTLAYTLSGPSVLAEVLQAVLYSSYVSFFLAMLNAIDPSPIPIVDYFKQQLKK